MENQKKICTCLLLGILTLLIFSACNGNQSKAVVDKNERISQRLNLYISARKHSNLGQLQQLYLKPEQARVGKIIVKECKVINIKISENGLAAETKLENKIQAMGFTFEKVPLTIKWVWNVDDWYIEIPGNSGNPFVQKKSAK